MNSLTLSSLAKDAVKENSCYDWKDIVALVASVVGVAASIFAQSTFGILGFTLFGAMILYNCYENASRISAIETQLTNSLKSAELRFASSAKEIQKEEDDFKANQEQLTASIADLKQGHAKLQELDRQFSKEEVQLTQNNQVLTQDTTALKKHLEVSSENGQQIRALIQTMTAENLRLGQSTGLFGKNVQTLDKVQQQLKSQMASFEKEFDGDAETLIKQILSTQESSKILIDAVAKRCQNLEEKFQLMTTILRDRSLTEINIANMVSDLNKKRDDLKQQMEGLASARKELTQSQIRFQDEQKRVEKRIASLNEDLKKGEKLQKEAQVNSEELRKRMGETVRRHEAELLEVDSKLETKRQQLSEIEKNIGIIPTYTAVSAPKKVLYS